MKDERFEEMLSGGHPNSLGKTIEVVDIVLADAKKLEALYNCYFSKDEVVRLRTSNAIKRISKERPDWLVQYIDKFIGDIAKIDQASTQWTLANLFDILHQYMTPKQVTGAKKIMKHNLATHSDWIVLNNTMQTLANWATTDSRLHQWLIPHLLRLSSDKRKSVSSRAKKLIDVLDK